MRHAESLNDYLARKNLTPETLKMTFDRVQLSVQLPERNGS